MRISISSILMLIFLAVASSCSQSVSPGDCFEKVDFVSKGGGFGMTWSVDDVKNEIVHYSIYAQISGPDGKGIKTSVGYGGEAKKTASVEKFLSSAKKLGMEKVDCE